MALLLLPHVGTRQGLASLPAWWWEPLVNWIAWRVRRSMEMQMAAAAIGPWLRSTVRSNKQMNEMDEEGGGGTNRVLVLATNKITKQPVGLVFFCVFLYLLLLLPLAPFTIHRFFCRRHDYDYDPDRYHYGVCRCLSFLFLSPSLSLFLSLSLSLSLSVLPSVSVFPGKRVLARWVYGRVMQGATWSFRCCCLWFQNKWNKKRGRKRKQSIDCSVLPEFKCCFSSW